MPIVNDDDIVQAVAVPQTVKIAAPEYRGITVDTRYEPLDNLLTHVEGSSWTVEYYAQVLNDNNQVQGQQPNLNPVFQSYKLIRGMELKVTSPLATSQDAQTNTTELRGAANLYPFLIPNVGDQFLADIGDGREAIFKILTSERKSVFKDTIYTIEYAFVRYSTADLVGDLNQKTVQTLYFVRDFLNYGQSPMLQESEYFAVKQLVERYHEMLPRYFAAYTRADYRTILAPGQAPRAVYDHFLVKALKRHYDTDQAPELRSLRTMNVDDDPAMTSFTLWELLSRRQPRQLAACVRRVGLMSAKTFERRPLIEGIFWSGIDYVVYPQDPTLDVNYDAVVAAKVITGEVTLQEQASTLSSIAELLDPTTEASLPYPDAPLIHPVLVDDYYVLSQAFYDQAPTGQSKLELAIGDYLHGRAQDNRLLLAFCDTYHAFGGLEKFYYLPLILLLIKASIRSV